MRPPATGPVSAVRWHRTRRCGTETITRLFRQRPAAERFAERMDDEGRGPIAVYVADLDRWQMAR